MPLLDCHLQSHVFAGGGGRPGPALLQFPGHLDEARRRELADVGRIHPPTRGGPSGVRGMPRGGSFFFPHLSVRVVRF